jgi:hypothetical protein
MDKKKNAPKNPNKEKLFEQQNQLPPSVALLKYSVFLLHAKHCCVVCMLKNHPTQPNQAIPTVRTEM